MINKLPTAWLAALLFILSWNSSAKAGLVLSLETTQAALAASGGTVTLTAFLTGTESEVLTGYDLFFDISNVDLVASNNASGPVTVGNFVQLSLKDGTNLFSGGAATSGNRDVFTSGIVLVGSGDDTSGGLSLFSFDATFAANTANKDLVFDFSYLMNDIEAAILIDGTPIDLASVAHTGTSITVSAVPEPGLGGVAALVGCWLVRRYRRT